MATLQRGRHRPWKRHGSPGSGRDPSGSIFKGFHPKLTVSRSEGSGSAQTRTLLFTFLTVSVREKSGFFRPAWLCREEATPRSLAPKIPPPKIPPQHLPPCCPAFRGAYTLPEPLGLPPLGGVCRQRGAAGCCPGAGSVSPGPPKCSGRGPRPGEGWGRDELCPATRGSEQPPGMGAACPGLVGGTGAGAREAPGSPRRAQPLLLGLSQRFCKRAALRGAGCGPAAGAEAAGEGEEGRAGLGGRPAEGEKGGEGYPGAGRGVRAHPRPPRGSRCSMPAGDGWAGGERRWAAARRGTGRARGSADSPGADPTPR